MMNPADTAVTREAPPDIDSRLLQISMVALILAGAAIPLTASALNGDRALEYTRRAVEFGPRPAGSEANRKLQAYIRWELRACRCDVRDDSFKASTPRGEVTMTNIIARFPGKSGRAVAVTGHFDTKPVAGFVGANDGGSSTGLLLELAHALVGRSHADDIILVWFDGEEAFETWGPKDGLYGSRHLAARWAADGTLARIKALVNIDMIGDKDLGILRESNSTPALRALAWAAARHLGASDHFLDLETPIEDDHLPFLERGVKALDLIDFSYGPDNTWWHTTLDTIDKLSSRSLETTGAVVLELIRRLESRVIE